MRARRGVIVFLIALAAPTAGCASNRVRAGQATEIRQEEVYEPETKVEPPEGNIRREPEAYPVLEVDLERRQEPYQPAPDSKEE